MDSVPHIGYRYEQNWNPCPHGAYILVVMSNHIGLALKKKKAWINIKSSRISTVLKVLL